MERAALLAFTLVIAGCGSVLYEHSRLVDPKSEQASEVTVYRDSSAAGIIFRATVYLDDEALMALARSSFGRVFVAPGRYAIYVSHGGRGVGGPVEFAPGRSYDLMISPQGFGAPNLYDLRSRDAERASRELTPVGDAAAGRRRFPWDPSQACGRGIAAAEREARGRGR